MMIVTSFFFFQAQDGIRYSTVTGVRTCALPISESVGEAVGRVAASLNSKGEEIKTALVRGRDDLVDQLSSHGNDLIKRLTQTGQDATASLAEIGRASCRERV